MKLKSYRLAIFSGIRSCDIAMFKPVNQLCATEKVEWVVLDKSMAPCFEVIYDLSFNLRFNGNAKIFQDTPARGVACSLRILTIKEIK
jgi:hypothetical protein